MELEGVYVLQIPSYEGRGYGARVSNDPIDSYTRPSFTFNTTRTHSRTRQSRPHRSSSRRGYPREDVDDRLYMDHPSRSRYDGYESDTSPSIGARGRNHEQRSYRSPVRNRSPSIILGHCSSSDDEDPPLWQRRERPARGPRFEELSDREDGSQNEETKFGEEEKWNGPIVEEVVSEEEDGPPQAGTSGKGQGGPCDERFRNFDSKMGWERGTPRGGDTAQSTSDTKPETTHSANPSTASAKVKLSTNMTMAEGGQWENPCYPRQPPQTASEPEVTTLNDKEIAVNSSEGKKSSVDAVSSVSPPTTAAQCSLEADPASVGGLSKDEERLGEIRRLRAKRFGQPAATDQRTGTIDPASNQQTTSNIFMMPPPPVKESKAADTQIPVTTPAAAEGMGSGQSAEGVFVMPAPPSPKTGSTSGSEEEDGRTAQGAFTIPPPSSSAIEPSTNGQKVAASPPSARGPQDTSRLSSQGVPRPTTGLKSPATSARPKSDGNPTEARLANFKSEINSAVADQNSNGADRPTSRNKPMKGAKSPTLHDLPAYDGALNTPKRPTQAQSSSHNPTSSASKEPQIQRPGKVKQTGITHIDAGQTGQDSGIPPSSKTSFHSPSDPLLLTLRQKRSGVSHTVSGEQTDINYTGRSNATKIETAAGDATEPDVNDRPSQRRKKTSARINTSRARRSRGSTGRTQVRDDRSEDDVIGHARFSTREQPKDGRRKKTRSHKVEQAAEKAAGERSGSVDRTQRRRRRRRSHREWGDDAPKRTNTAPMTHTSTPALVKRPPRRATESEELPSSAKKSRNRSDVSSPKTHKRSSGGFLNWIQKIADPSGKSAMR